MIGNLSIPFDNHMIWYDTIPDIIIRSRSSTEHPRFSSSKFNVSNPTVQETPSFCFIKHVIGGLKRTPNMPRYLTPSKIGLLTLISVYVEGHVSATATVPVLSFLITNLLPPRYNIKSEISKTSLSIQDFQNALSKLTSDFPGRTIWDLFLRRLWQFDSLDSLHVFFEVLPNLLAKTRDQLIQDRDNGHTQSNQGIRLSRTSPLGLFLRRAQVEFVRMQMEDGVRLWKSLLLFREPSRVIVRKRNPSVSKTGFDINIPLDGPVHDALYGNLIQSPTSITCAHDMEMLLDFQLEKIQSEYRHHHIERRQV